MFAFRDSHWWLILFMIEINECGLLILQINLNVILL
jgi:hypothetical protein